MSERINTPKTSLEGLTTEQGLLKIFQDSLKESSIERQRLTGDFSESLDALRKDFRIYNILMLLGFLAMSGVSIAAQNGLLTLTPRQSATTAATLGSAP